MDRSAIADLPKLSPDQRKFEHMHMLQELSADRIKLALHRETKGLLVYSLIFTNHAANLREATPGDTYPNGIKGFGGLPMGAGRMIGGNGQLTFQGLPMSALARLVAGNLGHIVLDKTGLEAKYDFTMTWPKVANQDSISTAIQEQLGLKLESRKIPMEVLVLDHAKRPGRFVEEEKEESRTCNYDRGGPQACWNSPLPFTPLLMTVEQSLLTVLLGCSSILL